MTRLEYILVTICIIITLSAIIWSKFVVSDLELQISLIERKIDNVKNDIKELEIKWIEINSPEKLRELAKKHFQNMMSKYSGQQQMYLQKRSHT